MYYFTEMKWRTNGVHYPDLIYENKRKFDKIEDAKKERKESIKKGYEVTKIRKE